MKKFNLCVIAITLILYLGNYKTANAQWGNTPSGPVWINAGSNTQTSAGIGTASPQAPLHIVGSGTANAQGWNKAIILDKNAALIWKGSTNSYFMAHPSNNPVGVEISKY